MTPPRTAPAAAPVPAGCDPASDRVDWSPVARTAEPIRIARDLGRPAAAEGMTRLVDRPFRPVIAGVAAPKSWRATLAASLSAATGDTVLATAARPGQATNPEAATGQVAEIIRYDAALAVSADFLVHCGSGVRGRFSGWTSVTSGAVSCDDDGSAADPAARMALWYCSDAPSLPGERHEEGTGED